MQQTDTMYTTYCPVHDNDYDFDQGQDKLLVELDEHELRDLIRKNQLEIHRLARSINDYKNNQDKSLLRIKVLEEENQILGAKIKTLETTAMEQKQNNNNLLERLEKIENDKHIQLLGFLLQDLNQRYGLRNNVTGAYRGLNNLRIERNNNAHYIRELDNELMGDLKATIICNHLTVLSPGIIEKTEKRYRCDNMINVVLKSVQDILGKKVLDTSKLNQDDRDVLEDLQDTLNEYK
jgi:uncharacterized Zn finger protein (UPF0148 family)